MTNNTPVTLNFSLLEGLEPGTDEFGMANLKMIMDFALDTIDEITRLAALAHLKGEVDTPNVSADGITKFIATEMMEQSVPHADMFMESYQTILPKVVYYWVKNFDFAAITDDGALYVDMEEVHAAMAAQKEAANA